MRPEIEAQITFLYTDELSEAGWFYGDVMGFKLALDQGRCRIYHTGEGAYLGVCQRSGGEAVKEKKGVIFTLVVEDVDGWFSYLEGRQIYLQEEPKISEEYGIYHFFLEDPDGYVLEIQRFLDEGWDQR